MKPTTIKEIVVEVKFPSDNNGSCLQKDHHRRSNMISKRASLDPTVQTLETSSCSDMFSISESEPTTGVRFNLEDTVYIPIPAIDDMPDDERRATWFTRENYDVIMGANTIAVKLMRIGRENPEAFGHCFRGLEYRLPEYRKDREERTRNAFQAVLEEQKRQREADEAEDPKVIAKMYRLATLSSLEIAMLRGESDAQAAASYQLEHASSTPPPSSRRQPSASSSSQVSKSTASTTTTKTTASTAKAAKSSPTEDDTISVLSDESSTADVMDVSEGQGLMNRLRFFVNKQHRSSGNSKSSSIKSHSRRSF